MLRLKNFVTLNQRGVNILVTSFKSNSTVTSSADTISDSDSEQIILPKRIKRGPTDLLRALSRTIGRDPTASHYKFHDDPFLMPCSVGDKKGFALAQEAGRKTAHWIKREHADLFQVIFTAIYQFMRMFHVVLSMIFSVYDRTATD